MNAEFELEPRDDKRASAARSQFYKVLSGVFAYPEGEERKDFVLRGAGNALRQAVADLPFAVPAVEFLGWQDQTFDVAMNYTSFFDNCKGRPPVSLHEKDYSRVDAKQNWEELIRFYEHFGLRYDFEGSKEWPDHVGIELEFLHYLTFLETGSPDESAEIYAAAEGDFLERHLAKWVPQFADKLAGQTEDSPYGALARVLAQFIEAEAEFNRQRRAAH